MERAGRGHIVALSSVAGFSGGASRGGRVQLSTAQFAIQGFAESLHAELRLTNSNIIVTLVHVYPFIVDAGMEKDIRLRYNISLQLFNNVFCSVFIYKSFFFFFTLGYQVILGQCQQQKQQKEFSMVFVEIMLNLVYQDIFSTLVTFSGN